MNSLFLVVRNSWELKVGKGGSVFFKHTAPEGPLRLLQMVLLAHTGSAKSK